MVLRMACSLKRVLTLCFQTSNCGLRKRCVTWVPCVYNRLHLSNILNTYIVKTGKVVTRYADKIVTFVNEHSEEIDLPDPQILELHAAFSRVLHLTGAGEYFESHWRDLDENRVLASDGSTSWFSAHGVAIGCTSNKLIRSYTSGSSPIRFFEFWKLKKPSKN